MRWASCFAAAYVIHTKKALTMTYTVYGFPVSRCPVPLYNALMSV